MMPFDRSTLDQSTSLDRRRFLLASLASGAASLAGCASPLMRGQTPEVDTPAEEKKLELVGDLRPPLRPELDQARIGGPGHEPATTPAAIRPPPTQRERLMIEMMIARRPPGRQDSGLADDLDGLCAAYLPPGVQKGDPLDVRGPRSRAQRNDQPPRRLADANPHAADGSAGRLGPLGQRRWPGPGRRAGRCHLRRRRRQSARNPGRVLGGGVSPSRRELGLAISQRRTPRSA